MLARVRYKTGLELKIVSQKHLGLKILYQNQYLVWYFVVFPGCVQNSGFLKILFQDFAFCSSIWLIISPHVWHHVDRCNGSNRRKLGSNTSVIWTNRIVRLDLDEGWCETLHYITIHHKRIDLDEGWCETLHHITIHHKRMDLDEGRCETLHYITIHHKRIDLDEGRCVTLHYITIHHKRIDLDEGRCKMHCNGCMNVAWGLCLGGRRSMKPCIFPCKVAAGGDERYLVCAAVAAAVVSVANVFLLFALHQVVVPVCVVLCVFWICGCRSQWNGCMNFCETSSCFEVDNIKNEAILRDFLIFRSWQHQKRSNSARLPHFSKLTTSKTKILCETSSKMESWVQRWRPRTNVFCDFSSPPV